MYICTSRAHACAHAITQAQTQAQANTHTDAHIRLQVLRRTRTHSRKHTPTPARTHTRTRAHTREHTDDAAEGGKKKVGWFKDLGEAGDKRETSGLDKGEAMEGAGGKRFFLFLFPLPFSILH